MQVLNERIELLQQAPQSEDQAKAKRLDKVRSGLWIAVSSALAWLVTRTGEALYDGWVQENLLPLLPDWVQWPWVAFAQGEQPTLPLCSPLHLFHSPNRPCRRPTRSLRR